jgi:hypothetical protein
MSLWVLHCQNKVKVWSIFGGGGDLSSYCLHRCAVTSLYFTWFVWLKGIKARRLPLNDPEYQRLSDLKMNVKSLLVQRVHNNLPALLSFFESSRWSNGTKTFLMLVQWVKSLLYHFMVTVEFGSLASSSATNIVSSPSIGKMAKQKEWCYMYETNNRYILMKQSLSQHAKLSVKMWKMWGGEAN